MTTTRTIKDRRNFAAQLLSEAVSLREDNRLEDALDVCERAARSDPFSPDIHLARANILHELVRPHKAIAAYRRVLDLEHTSLPAKFGLADNMARSGRTIAALKLYREVQQLLPCDIRPANGIARCLHLLGHYERASSAYRQVLEIDQENQSAQLGLASLGIGDTPDSLPAKMIARSFDGYADGFDEHLTKGLNYTGPQILERIFTDLRPLAKDLHMLDLGCGTGLCAPLFRDRAKWLAGIDLSAAMIEKARQKNLYDDLQVGDVGAELEQHEHVFDLVLAADVFCYIGDLSVVLKAGAKALKPGGLMIFSAEVGDEEPFALHSSFRYTHTRSYLEELAETCKFAIEHYEQFTGRHDGGVPVQQHAFALRVP